MPYTNQDKMEKWCPLPFDNYMWGTLGTLNFHSKFCANLAINLVTPFADDEHETCQRLRKKLASGHLF